MYKKMNLAVNEIFETTVKDLAQKDVLFVMPAFYPQRG